MTQNYNAVIIWHEKILFAHKILCHQKDNRKSKSYMDKLKLKLNLYYTKLTQCQHLGTVYILRFWKSILIYKT